MTPTMVEEITAAVRIARAAGHGQRTPILRDTAQRLGISYSTLQRHLQQIETRGERKRRADAGQTALTRDEALIISGVLMESARKNNTKRLYSVSDAIGALRANGMIRAEGVDPTTGEIRPLSADTVSRALRTYGLHPDQLLDPDPAMQLRSLHPNHVWQIDASLCVLYYLRPSQNTQENGLRVMAANEFYKNKPKNLSRIAQDRVWSYEITDHTSGWIYVQYVMGAESGQNLCEVLMSAMAERGGPDVMHGVPKILMMDPGSANTSAMTRNLCRALGIEPIAHAPGAARVTGQVENARNLIERKFESALKFRPVHDLNELNARARQWRVHFNGTAVHSRHNRTRSEAWLRIREDQLIKAPPVDVMRELAVANPEEKKVDRFLRVAFGGRPYDVSEVPGVMVGDYVPVTRNPWRNDAVQVLRHDEDGHQVAYVCPAVEKDENGFAASSPVVGETFQRHGETPAQKAKVEIDQVVMGVSSQAEATAARKEKALPFGGRFDPYAVFDEATLPTYMPRRGREHSVSAPRLEFAPLSHVDAAKVVKPEIEAAGGEWTPASYRWLIEHFPDGLPADQIDAVVRQLSPAATPQRPVLRAVGGE